MLAEEIAGERVVGSAEERARAAGAALGDVVRASGSGRARRAMRRWLRSGEVSIECTVTVISVGRQGQTSEQVLGTMHQRDEQ